jgi:hypothetical protein
MTVAISGAGLGVASVIVPAQGVSRFALQPTSGLLIPWAVRLALSDAPAVINFLGSVTELTLD